MLVMNGKKVIDVEGGEGSEEEFEGGRAAAGGSVDHAHHADDRTQVGPLGGGGGVEKAPTGVFAGPEEELELRRNQVVELWARLKACDDKRRQYKEEAKQKGGSDGQPRTEDWNHTAPPPGPWIQRNHVPFSVFALWSPVHVDCGAIWHGQRYRDTRRPRCATDSHHGICGADRPLIDWVPPLFPEQDKGCGRARR